MSRILRHTVAVALVRLAPIRDRWVWFLVSMLVTVGVGGTLPSLGAIAPPGLLAESGPWIPDAAPPPPAAGLLHRARRVASSWPAEDWIVGPGAPAWTGLLEEPSHRTDVTLLPAVRPPVSRGGLEIHAEDDFHAVEALMLLRGLRRVQDAEARAELGVTVDPRRAVTVHHVDVPRPAPRGLPTPDGVGALLLGVALLHGLGLLAAGLPRWRSHGFHATLRVSPLQPISLLLGGLLAALVGGGLAAGSALVGWWCNGLVRGVVVEFGWHHLLVPVALVPGLVLAQRAFLTAPDTRAAGFRVVGMQMALGVLGAVWLLAVAGQGLEAGAAVPFVGMLALATGLVPVEASTLAVALASAVVTTGLVLLSSSRLLANDPVEAGDPTLRRRARGNHLPEVVLLLLLAVGGTTTFTLPLQRLGASVGLVVGQLGFMLAPALLIPLALSRPAGPLLGLGRPGRRAWLLAPIIALGAAALSVLALQLSSAVLSPGAQAAGHALGRHLQEMSQGPGLLLLTLLPALCEELLFRGAILGLLRPRLPDWAAVLLQAAAFALIHGMLLRIGPTIALGLLLGILRLRTRSIWPGVVVHALHNALLFGIAAALPGRLGAPPGLLFTGLGLAAAVGLLGVWMSRGR